MNKHPVVIVGLVVLTAAGGWWLADALAPEATTHQHQLEARTDAAGNVYYTCAMHPQVRQDAPGNCPICGMKLSKREEASAGAERQVLYWYDPMRPDQHFDQPGKSPFMDMQLVPKYAAGDGSRDGGLTVVEIDPRMAQNLGMRTAPVTTGRFWQRVDATGSVAVDERRMVTVTSRATGWVERLDVRAVGESVRAGQVLARVYAPEVLAAQEELALGRELDDPVLVDAARTRLRLLDVRADATPQRQFAVVAPQAGVVTDLMVREGAELTPGMALMTLADLSRVWVLVEIPEAQAGWVRVGTPAEARLRSQPGEALAGEVEFLYPQLDAPTRTLRARLAFDNVDGHLRPGMYADVALFGGPRDDVTLVPSEAVIRTGTRSMVIQAEAEGRYRPVAVTLGDERDGQFIVLDGLTAGDEVVVSGQFLIDSEASLLGAYQRMAPRPASGETESRP